MSRTNLNSEITKCCLLFLNFPPILLSLFFFCHFVSLLLQFNFHHFCSRGLAPRWFTVNRSRAKRATELSSLCQSHLLLSQNLLVRVPQMSASHVLRVTHHVCHLCKHWVTCSRYSQNNNQKKKKKWRVAAFSSDKCRDVMCHGGSAGNSTTWITKIYISSQNRALIDARGDARCSPDMTKLSGYVMRRRQSVNTRVRM